MSKRTLKNKKQGKTSRCRSEGGHYKRPRHTRNKNDNNRVARDVEVNAIAVIRFLKFKLANNFAMGEEEEKKPGGEGIIIIKNNSIGEAAPVQVHQDINIIVLNVFMHCEGCARKVRRCLKGFQGVESVETDCRSHRVVVKGEKADPLKVLGRLQTKTHRRVQLISPIQNPKTDQQPHIITVVLKVHMHCEACALEIKTRIHRMKGVESVEADLKSSEVRVKGAIDPTALVEYVHRRTGKHAAIIAKQEPELVKPPAENNSELEGAKAKDNEDKLLEDKKQEPAVPAVHEEITKVEEKAEAQEPAVPAAAEEEEAVKVVEEKIKNEYNNNKNICYPQRYIMEMYPCPPPPMIAQEIEYPPPPPHKMVDTYPPPVIAHAYPPQMFSDENPNACSLM